VPTSVDTGEHVSALDPRDPSRRRPRRWAWALAAAVLIAPSLGHAEPAPAAAPTAAQPEDAARSAIDRAKQAARAGDYRTALAEFETAMQRQPSPRIQFNVAVCHHQLMLAEPEGSAVREEHRRAAVTSYRAYLDGTPEAEDRADVERIIAELGGDAPRPGLRLERIDPDDPVKPPPQLHEISVPRVEPDGSSSGTAAGTATPSTDPSPVVPPPVPQGFRARIGPFVPLVLAHMGQITDNDAIAPLPMIGLGVRGAALLGARDRAHVGAEIGAYGQPTATRTRHTLLAMHVVAAADYALPLGRSRRFELAFGGTLGFAFQQLRSRDTTTTTCFDRARGGVSTRGGLLLGGRIGLLVLLGKRRNHELGLRFGPALTVQSAGTRGDRGDFTDEECERTPFQQIGLKSGAGLVTMIDLGYAPRF